MFKNQRILTRIPVNEKIALAEKILQITKSFIRKINTKRTSTRIL